MIFVSAPLLWVILICIHASFGKWHFATLIIPLGGLHLLSREAPLELNIDPWFPMVKKAPLGIITAPLGLGPPFALNLHDVFLRAIRRLAPLVHFFGPVGPFGHSLVLCNKQLGVFENILGLLIVVFTLGATNSSSDSPPSQRFTSLAVSWARKRKILAGERVN